VIVTGGGSGIGRATATAFAAQGADVLIVGRTESRLAEVARDVPGVHVLAADITAPDGPQRVVNAAVAEFGRIDVVVNNAGIVSGAAQDVLATNLLAPMYLTQAALPHLTASSGLVVNVSTSIGQRGWPLPDGALYAAAKSALESLTRSWAVQFARHGVRVAAVAPGPIATAISQNRGLTTEQTEALRAELVAHVPLGRIGRPEEVAAAIAFLASDDASFITGAVLPVDAGWTAQ